VKAFLILKLVSLFDYFHKRKIIQFFNKKNIATDTIFDIGGHHGETLSLFLNNFSVKKIYSFEPILENFQRLNQLSNLLEKKYKVKIVRENYGCGVNAGQFRINQLNESSSSTIKQLNLNSKYFKKKDFFLNLKNNIKLTNIKLINLSDYIQSKSIKKIDLLKIDTEGYEFEVLLGLNKDINIVNCILFEHHYDDMIEKKYKFSDINNFLINHNFRQILKLKMFFRKTFEYIYIK
jgi:FkbM family methyltransferase